MNKNYIRVGDNGLGDNVQGEIEPGDIEWGGFFPRRILA